MQKELSSAHPLLRITIGGINQVGHDSGNAGIMSGRKLTWVQDIDADQNSNGEVWDDWQADWRDVFVLDGSNTNVNLYNLTVHDLRVPENYAELKSILINTAMVSQKPYTYEPNAVDVDGNGTLAPLDALLVINRLNSGGSGPLAPPTGASISAYVDVDGNLIVAPIDALRVINALNQRTGGGEGGGEGESGAALFESLLAGESGADRLADNLSNPVHRAVGAERSTAHDAIFAQWEADVWSDFGELGIGIRPRRTR